MTFESLQDGVDLCGEEEQCRPRFPEVEPHADWVLLGRKSPHPGPSRRLEYLCMLKLVVAPRSTNPRGEGIPNCIQSDFNLEDPGFKGHPCLGKWCESLAQGYPVTSNRESPDEVLTEHEALECQGLDQ